MWLIELEHLEGGTGHVEARGIEVGPRKVTEARVGEAEQERPGMGADIHDPGAGLNMPQYHRDQGCMSAGGTAAVSILVAFQRPSQPPAHSRMLPIAWLRTAADDSPRPSAAISQSVTSRTAPCPPGSVGGWGGGERSGHVGKKGRSRLRK